MFIFAFRKLVSFSIFCHACRGVGLAKSGRSRVADLSGLWLLFILIFGKDGQDFGRLFRGYYRVVVIVVRVVVIGAGGVLI